MTVYASRWGNERVDAANHRTGLGKRISDTGTELRLYLDACCLSRLTDDQRQARVRAEAGAVERIMRMIREGVASWVSSTVLSIEVSRNPDRDRRREAEALLSFADELFVPEGADANRAQQIEELGFTAFDALHLACAERLAAEVFLTTDDVLLRRARRVGDALHVRVENPISWYQEVRP